MPTILHKLFLRKRKAGKLDMFRTETLPPRIPVIMQDELCEDNFNMSKQPIILRCVSLPLSENVIYEVVTITLYYREEPDNYNSYRPPNYYGSGRMDEEFSECESLVNGVSAGSISGHGINGHHMGGAMGGGGAGYHHATLPAHHTPYARPPPVALEFSDSLNRSSRHRPAPMYRRQQFNP